jgi:acyl-coenzyme A synthetase/AMP-(fatty) acid ligase
MNAAERLLAGDPARIALIEGDVRIDYAGLRADSIRSAAALLDAGLRPGDACVLALPDGIEWAAAFIGMLWAGVRPIAINPRTATTQLADLMLDSGAAAALLEDEAARALGDKRAIDLGEWRRRVERATATPAAAQAADDDPAFLLYSSGTTGRPKGILHAHRAIRDAHVFARDLLGARPEHRFYSSSKLFFAYPLANAFFAGLRLGATVVLDPEWPDPARVAAMVERHEPHIFFSVPTLYRRLVDAGVRFRRLHAAVSAGEACPPALARDWQAMTGVPLLNGYGTTETLSLVLYRTPEMDAACPTPLTDHPPRAAHQRRSSRPGGCGSPTPRSRSAIRAWSPTTARASPTAASPPATSSAVPPTAKAGCSPAAATSSSRCSAAGWTWSRSSRPCRNACAARPRRCA